MIEGVNHITLAVKDIDRSFNFYRNVLRLKPLCKWKKGAYFLVGNFWFCLNLDDKTEPTKDLTHFAFSVNKENFKALSDKIIKANCPIWKKNTSEGASLYFQDYDGHKLEIHIGDWKTRMKDANSYNWEDVEFF